MTLRRVLPAAAVLPFLLVIPACSSDSDSDKGSAAKKPTVTATKTPSADIEAAAEAKRLGALDTPSLEKVTLSGKSNGFEAKKIATAEVAAGKDMKADKPECQPIASLAGGYTNIEPVSVVHRSLEPTEVENATVGSMWLASHSEKNAKQVMKDLRTSLKECPAGFKTLGLTYKSVDQLKDPNLGDEAVGYRITGAVAKQSVPMTYTVVRSGGVIAVFYGVNMLDAKKAAIPEPVVKAQLERLSTQTG